MGASQHVHDMPKHHMHVRTHNDVSPPLHSPSCPCDTLCWCWCVSPSAHATLTWHDVMWVRSEGRHVERLRRRVLRHIRDIWKHHMWSEEPGWNTYMGQHIHTSMHMQHVTCIAPHSLFRRQSQPRWHEHIQQHKHAHDDVTLCDAHTTEGDV